MDWMYLAQDRVHCWTLVNMVMNLRVPEKARNILFGCAMSSQRQLHCVSYGGTQCSHLGPDVRGRRISVRNTSSDTFVLTNPRIFLGGGQL
jgi:hypothetical protein